MFYKKITQTIKDAVFPRFCIQCKNEGSLLCEECFVLWQPGKLQIVDGDQHLHSWQYADPIARELICSWKYHFDQSAWKIMQAKLRPSLIALQHLVHIHSIEVIVPVPLHSIRMCERGFDQAVMIAEFLSSELDLPVASFIKRNRSTGHQTERETQDRIESMKKSPFTFVPATSKESCLPNSILLIDDVWTTGATINAATSVLQKVGIEKIWKYTLARG